MLGANLGGAIPPFIATLSAAASARRVTAGNLAVRAIGCLIALPLAGPVADFLQTLSLSPAKLPVDIHLLFNVALAIARLAVLVAFVGRHAPAHSGRAESGDGTALPR